MHTLICVTFPLPPGVGGWLRLLLVALPGRFCLPFYSLYNTKLRHQIHFLRVRRHQALSMKRGSVFFAFLTFKELCHQNGQRSRMADSWRENAQTSISDALQDSAWACRNGARKYPTTQRSQNQRWSSFVPTSSPSECLQVLLLPSHHQRVERSANQ